MKSGVGVCHNAHIVVRESMKLLIRVLLPWVRCGSRTMRGVFLGMKDGKVMCCGIRCGCKCMRFPVQRSALKQRSECVGRGAKYRKDRKPGEFGEKRRPDCPYVWLLCENVTQKGTKQNGWGKNESRAACYAACSCNLHRGRKVAEDLQYSEPPGKSVKSGLPGARGRVSWDPVVADPPKRGVQSEDRPCRGQAFRGRDTRRAWRKKARSARTRVTYGPWSTEPQKKLSNY